MASWTFAPPQHEHTRAHVVWPRSGAEQEEEQVSVCDVAITCSCNARRVACGDGDAWVFVTDLQTRRDLRRCGLASRLLQRLASYNTVCLFADPHSRAHGLYASLGFRQQRNVPPALEPHRPTDAAVFMVMDRISRPC